MSERHDRDEPHTPLLEWIAATLGGACAAGVVGYLVWDGLSGAHAPAELTVRVESITRGPAGFQLALAVANQGGRTAAEARVAVRSEGPGGEEERGELSFDYVPGHSLRHGTLLFRHRPDPDRLELQVLGYRDP
ncbi:hypothetical protein [Geminicoccus roseus]|uniref:hypothetical protein n=1 Tax=Geminicoccus roseus TaxID=404900 RepID=UPI0004200731|nr:hypothetical protein [Geminicoccus roseus]